MGPKRGDRPFHSQRATPPDDVEGSAVRSRVTKMGISPDFCYFAVDAGR